MAGLSSLIRLRRFELDAERQAVAALEEQRAAVVAALERLEAALAAEQADVRRRSAEDPLSGVGYADFARRTRLEQQRHESQRALLDALIEARREKLADAFRDLKTLEETEAGRKRAIRAARAAAEAEALDEIAIEGFRRRADEIG